MKLVMTLLARDEADIVDAQIKFHLNAGVDFVIATDNLSVDGTTDILESYARDGYLHLIREDSEYLHQADWITRMGRLAATDFGADWVLHSDADEFWWPRGESLRDVLASIPERYGIVRALRQAGRLHEHYESLVVDDDALGRGLEDGSLVLDTRLRDALRALRVDGAARELALPVGGQGRLKFPRPSVVDDAAYAV